MTETINAVDRILDIIMFLYSKRKEMGITEISKELGLSKSTIHRNLATLENRGFVTQNPETGKYWLGLKFYSIGMAVGQKISIKEITKPFVEELNKEFNEVVSVSVLSDHSQNSLNCIVVYKNCGKTRLQTVNTYEGSIMDIHCSAAGKCLLAFNNELINEEKFNDLNVKKYTNKTIISWEELEYELKKVKENGCSIEDEEYEVGLICIAAPILNSEGEAIATISLSGPVYRVKTDDFDYRVKRVIETAKLISENIK